MSMFENLGKSGQNQPNQQQQMNPMQAVNQLKQNPASFLKQAGYSIPANANNPNQIIQHLLQSGQIPQSRLTAAQQMLSQMMQKR